MKQKKLSTILKDAADLLDEHGWCRYALKDEKGRMCIMGALNAAANGDAEISYAQLDVRAIAKALGDCQVGELVDWNDEIARDRRSVTRRLRAAVRRLEA